MSALWGVRIGERKNQKEQSKCQPVLLDPFLSLCKESTSLSWSDACTSACDI